LGKVSRELRKRTSRKSEEELTIAIKKEGKKTRKPRSKRLRKSVTTGKKAPQEKEILGGGDSKVEKNPGGVSTKASQGEGAIQRITPGKKKTKRRGTPRVGIEWIK